VSDTNKAIDEAIGASSATHAAADATNAGSGATAQPSGAPHASERVRLVLAVGPNTEGVLDQVRAAHTREEDGHVPPPPDPANVDDTGEFTEPPPAPQQNPDSPEG
jgi:hypothetical protein